MLRKSETQTIAGPPIKDMSPNMGGIVTMYVECAEVSLEL